MPDAGSNSPELLITVDRDAKAGLRQQIEAGLRHAVRDGRLPSGTRLPSSRALAEDIGVTRRVVQDAYEQLVAEGYLSARVGSGTTVNDTHLPSDPPAPDQQGPAIRFDLRPSFPDLRLFPRSQWNRASSDALLTMAHDELGYIDHRGLGRFRQVVIDYLARVRGVCSSGTDVIACNGFGHGLSMAGAVVVTPAHQAPLGVVMSPERMLALAQWARQRGGWIIEDDYDAEFRYDRNPIGAVQGLAVDRTIYIGTLSKCLAPGLRLGWVVAPCETSARITRIRGLLDGTTSTILQATLATFVERGDLDRHIRRSRKEYLLRRDALVAALTDVIPGIVLGEVAAGLHVPMTLPLGVDENRVVATALARGLLFESLATFRVRDTVTPPTLVVVFGRVRIGEAQWAAGALAQAIDDASA